MKCEEYQQLVEDYFDGELDEETCGRVALHLNTCAACAAALDALGRERELYLRYECDAAPSPTFWDDVMARATEPAAGARPAARAASRFRQWLGHALGSFNAPRLSPSLTALIVVAAIGLTVVVMRYVNSRGARVEQAAVSPNEVRSATLPSTATTNKAIESRGTEEENEARAQAERSGEERAPRLTVRSERRSAPTVAAIRTKGTRGSSSSVRSSPVSGSSPTPEELVREAEQKYVTAINMLSRDVSRRRSRLDPETAARFERTLLAVDRNIADTRRAARKHPGDPVAAQYMLAAYSKKVDVLRAIIGY